MRPNTLGCVSSGPRHSRVQSCGRNSTSSDARPLAPQFRHLSFPLERDQPRVAGPPLQQRRIRNNGLVRAGVTARPHQVEDAQGLEAEGVARRHGRGLFIPPDYRTEQKMNTSTAEDAVQWLFLDLNAFFAWCEQQENPALRGKPIIVVQTPTDSACAIAASYAATGFGIKTGTLVRDARRLCPGVIPVQANHLLYTDYHDRILTAVDICLPVAKVCSIDEMACRLMGTERQVPAARELALNVVSGEFGFSEAYRLAERLAAVIPDERDASLVIHRLANRGNYVAGQRRLGPHRIDETGGESSRHVRGIGQYVPASTGTGKSHPAVAIARRCIRAGARGRCHTAADLVNRLETEARAGRRGRIADRLTRLDFLILDPAASCCSTWSGSTSKPRSWAPPISLSPGGCWTRSRRRAIRGLALWEACTRMASF
jgi:hypothetical protein